MQQDDDAAKRNDDDIAFKLERYALWYLTRFGSVSVRQFRKRLEAKLLRLDEHHGHDAAIVDAVVAKTQSLGLIDDKQAASIRIRKLESRGWSQNRIARDLKHRGIDDGVIEEALAQHDNGDWQAALTLARRRKLGPWRQLSKFSVDPNPGAENELPDDQLISRELRIFASRGFNYSTARRIVMATSIDDLLVDVPT